MQQQRQWRLFGEQVLQAIVVEHVGQPVRTQQINITRLQGQDIQLGLDFGAHAKGFNSDTTRTVVLGEASEFAKSFDSEEAKKGWCLYELGCKGPVTYNNCPKVKFNQTNWPIRAGAPCIGCSEPGFWDKLSPFYEN